MLSLVAFLAFALLVSCGYCATNVMFWGVLSKQGGQIPDQSASTTHIQMSSLVTVLT